MSSTSPYSPLPRAEDDSELRLLNDGETKHHFEDDSYDSFNSTRGPPAPTPFSLWLPRWTAIISLLAAGSALVANALSAGVGSGRASSVVGMQEVQGLQRPTLYPNYDKYLETMKVRNSAPTSMFPRTMIRTDRESPNEFYNASTHVYISDTNSMFFDFHLPKKHAHPICYVSALVPSPEVMEASSKLLSYSGDISGLRIYNVTGLTSTQRKRLSWETRPQRLNELGRVNFTHDERTDEWRLHEPTPRFHCEPNGVYTIEVTCEDCTLEFDETFVVPPLGIEVSMIA